MADYLLEMNACEFAERLKILSSFLPKRDTDETLTLMSVFITISNTTDSKKKLLRMYASDTGLCCRISNEVPVTEKAPSLPPFESHEDGLKAEGFVRIPFVEVEYLLQRLPKNLRSYEKVLFNIFNVKDDQFENQVKLNGSLLALYSFSYIGYPNFDSIFDKFSLEKMENAKPCKGLQILYSPSLELVAKVAKKINKKSIEQRFDPENKMTYFRSEKNDAVWEWIMALNKED